jgi:hypothetical protein
MLPPKHYLYYLCQNIFLYSLFLSALLLCSYGETKFNTNKSLNI